MLPNVMQARGANTRAAEEGVVHKAAAAVT